ncbi:hypothetical protein LSAT2_026616 [Lamellibrachia satsuma]|nr:hypothetical protein LSAT2_026616 [Lamellibrachia satsuma]
MDWNSLEHAALKWTQHAWRRTVEEDIKLAGKICIYSGWLAKDRADWIRFAGSLCSRGREGDTASGWTFTHQQNISVHVKTATMKTLLFLAAVLLTCSLSLPSSSAAVARPPWGDKYLFIQLSELWQRGVIKLGSKRPQWDLNRILSIEGPECSRVFCTRVSGKGDQLLLSGIFNHPEHTTHWLTALNGFLTSANVVLSRSGK